MQPTVVEIATALNLCPHPEGGFFRETYRAADELETPRGPRAACTAILFLVSGAAPSRLHRLASDELWIAQAGLPVELATITPGGELKRHLLGQSYGVWDGSGFVAGELEAPAPQVLVPAGHWQGARLAQVSGAVESQSGDRDWSLVSCVVTPGFSFEDFKLGERAALLAEYPQHEHLITALTLAG